MLIVMNFFFCHIVFKNLYIVICYILEMIYIPDKTYLIKKKTLLKGKKLLIVMNFFFCHIVFKNLYIVICYIEEMIYIPDITELISDDQKIIIPYNLPSGKVNSKVNLSHHTFSQFLTNKVKLDFLSSSFQSFS